jgi:hypothetical protein
VSGDFEFVASDDAGGFLLLRDGTPNGWAAVVRLAAILAVTLIVAAWRIRHLKPTDDG